jgi:hypothetical protein
MLFLVELDHVKSGAMLTPETGKEFIEKIIFPTLARRATCCGKEDSGRGSRPGAYRAAIHHRGELTSGR